MDVERECGKWFSLSAHTFRLILSNVQLTSIFNFKTIFAILSQYLYIFIVFFLYPHAVLKPLNCEYFVVELTIEFRLCSHTDWLWLGEFKEEWIFHFLQTLLVGHGGAWRVEKFEFFVLSNDKDLTCAETFANIIKCLGRVCAGVCWNENKIKYFWCNKILFFLPSGNISAILSLSVFFSLTYRKSADGLISLLLCNHTTS